MGADRDLFTNLSRKLRMILDWQAYCIFFDDFRQPSGKNRAVAEFVRLGGSRLEPAGRQPAFPGAGPDCADHSLALKRNIRSPPVNTFKFFHAKQKDELIRR